MSSSAHESFGFHGGFKARAALALFALFFVSCGSTQKGSVGDTLAVGSLELTVTSVQRYSDGFLISISAKNAGDDDYDLSKYAFEAVGGDGLVHDAGSTFFGPELFSSVTLIRGASFYGQLYFPDVFSIKELRYEPAFSFNKALIRLED